MFQEHIAELTAAHFRTHIRAYLAALETEFTGSNKLRLKVPDISSVSLVGGVIQAEASALPIIGVDCLDKQVVPSQESLNYYQYEGAIVGMASGSDEESTDKAVKRYQRVVEQFVRTHQFLHKESNTNYAMREFLYASTRFSGSLELDIEDEKIWVAGFTTTVLWITSEEAESQHL
jgi:hypothetical protein